MTPERRREAIMAALRKAGQASVEALAEALGASRETIRRDLAELDTRGLLRKIHGGAVVAEPGVAASGIEGPLSLRMGQNVGAKRAIARAAAGLLRPGDSLFVDTGSTTIFLAEELSTASGLTVITNSATTAALAAKGEGAAVFLVGGAFRRGGGESVGPLALMQIRQFRPAHAFLTVAAADARGFADHDAEEAQVARAMLDQAAQVTILADFSKMGRAALFPVAAPAEVDRLVADAVPEGLAARLSEAGVEIVLAAEGSPQAKR